jgi:hypothetical protein
MNLEPITIAQEALLQRALELEADRCRGHILHTQDGPLDANEYWRHQLADALTLQLQIRERGLLFAAKKGVIA